MFFVAKGNCLDFFLFSNLKSSLRSRDFRSNEGVRDAVDEYFRDQEEGFCFEGQCKLEQRWKKCIKAKRDFVQK